MQTEHPTAETKNKDTENSSSSYKSESDLEIKEEQSDKLSSDQMMKLYSLTILKKKLKSYEKALKTVCQELPIKESHAKMILEDMGYARIYEYRSSLKTICKIMGIKLNEFLRLFINNGQGLEKHVNSLRKKHPSLIKYLCLIFKENERWNTDVTCFTKFEKAYERCYFDKKNSELIKSKFLCF